MQLFLSDDRSRLGLPRSVEHFHDSEMMLQAKEFLMRWHLYLEMLVTMSYHTLVDTWCNDPNNSHHTQYFLCRRSNRGRANCSVIWCTLVQWRLPWSCRPSSSPKPAFSTFRISSTTSSGFCNMISKLVTFYNSIAALNYVTVNWNILEYLNIFCTHSKSANYAIHLLLLDIWTNENQVWQIPCLIS